MKVILRKNFDKLGSVGEVVEVKDGYARNYLIPRNIEANKNPRTKPFTYGEKKDK